MFDIGFWELLVIAVVLLLVLGPERLPEVAKQAAFFLRKARQGIFRIRNEMRSEIGDPFQGLSEARQEVNNLKNDVKQFGRDLADSHVENKDNVNKSVKHSAKAEDAIGPEGEVIATSKATSVNKKVTNKVSKKKVSKKKTSKKVSKKKTSKKKTSKKTSKKS